MNRTSRMWLEDAFLNRPLTLTFIRAYVRDMFQVLVPCVGSKSYFQIIDRVQEQRRLH